MSVRWPGMNRASKMSRMRFRLAFILGLSALRALAQEPEMPGMEPTLVRLPTADDDDHLQPIHTSKPDYTPEARAAGIEGDVILSVSVGADGHPTSIRVLQSLNPALDQNAVRSMAMWRFRPKHRNRQAISAQMVVQIEYRLDPNMHSDVHAFLNYGITSAPRLQYKADPDL